MGREQYRTSDEDVAAEFDRVCHLFRLAMGRPSQRVLFESLMTEASERGMNWVQGLEYVLLQRDPEPPRAPQDAQEFTACAVPGDPVEGSRCSQ